MNPMLMPQAAFAMPMGVPEVPQGQMVQPAPADPQSYLKPASGIAKTLPKLKGFASSPYMAKGLGAASRAAFSGDWGNLLGGFADATAEYQAANQKLTTVGGPDDAFEITTDPNDPTKRTYKPIEAVQSYLRDKAEAAAAIKLRPELKEVRDARGAVGSAIAKLPPEKQAAAYEMIRQDPASWGIPDGVLPEYDADAIKTMGGMGFTAPQAAAADARQTTQVLQADKFVEQKRATGVREGFQGQANGRANAASARAASKSTRARSGGGGARAPKAPITSMSTADLLRLVGGK